ncbi:MAG: hypothetical protein HY770_01345 [Chitinivibrionia bacterium]|nr:hypothetical protein [Chitinivibrionia bacterium]
MKSRTGLAAAAITVLLFACGVTVARAQHCQEQNQTTMQHQQMSMHEQMGQMQAMMQQMTQMMGKSHELSQTLGHMMDQQQGHMREQMQMMRQMSESMGMMAGNMRTNLEQCNQMIQDESIMRDPEMQQEMGRFRDNMMEMAGRMQHAVQNLEKMTKRLERENPGN